MKIRRLKIAHTMKWFSCGLRFTKKRLGFWALASLAFVPIAWLIWIIPIAGVLILAFLLPLVLASSIGYVDQIVARESKTEAPAIGERFKRNIKDVPTMFIAIFKRSDILMSVLALSIAALIAALLLSIADQLLGGPARTSPAGIFEVGFSAAAQLLVARTVVLVLYGLLIGAMLYAVPLVVIEHQPAQRALKYGFRAFTKNLIPGFVFLATLSAPLILAAMVAAFSAPLGTILGLVSGLIIFPLAINCCYCAFRLTFQAS